MLAISYYTFKYVMNHLPQSAKRRFSIFILLTGVFIFGLAYFNTKMLSQNLNNNVSKESAKQTIQPKTNTNKEEITNLSQVNLENQANSSKITLPSSPQPTPLNIKVTLDDESKIWEQLALVLVGALIGAVSSLVATLIQIRKQGEVTENQIEAAKEATKKQIEAAELTTSRQIEVAKEVTQIQLKAQQKQNEEEAKQLTSRLEHQKTQVEKQSELVSILTSQVTILEATLKHTKLDVFTKTYEILYSELSMGCASILRVVLTADEWDERLVYYSQGYRDIFANTLKNKIRHLGIDEFKEKYLNFFPDDRLLIIFCDRFEAFLKSAEESDSSYSIRTSLEYSGLAATYIVVCEVLNRDCSLRFRDVNLTEREGMMDEIGMPKPITSRIIDNANIKLLDVKK